MDLISVIVPVYNVKAYLDRCVCSILSQTYKNLEIILVDDGSTDGSSALCDQYQQKDARIITIHKKNEGLGSTRNCGLDVAKGAYVTFVDSDDWISADHIDNLYRRAIETEADCVIGSFTAAMHNGEVRARPMKLGEKLYTGSAVIDGLLLPIIGANPEYPQDVQLESSCCMNLYDLKLLRQYGIRFGNERQAVSEDLLFNVEVLYHANRCSTINEQGYFYFENQGSITRKYNSMEFQRTLNYYELVRKKLVEYNLLEKAACRLMRSFLMKIRVSIRHVVFLELAYSDKLQKIRKMITHETVQAVLMEYPIKSYIPAMRLLMYSMRNGNAGAVYWQIRLREKMKQSSFFRRVLKQIGIGR